MLLIVKDDQKFNQEITARIEKYGLEVMPFKRFLELTEGNKVSSFFHRWSYMLCDQKIYNVILKKRQQILLKRHTIPYPVDLKTIKQGNLDEELDKYYKSVPFMSREGPVFDIPACRVSQGDKESVKNIMNVIFNFIPIVLKESQKNSTVKKINLIANKSKALCLFRNEFVPESS